MVKLWKQKTQAVICLGLRGLFKVICQWLLCCGAAPDVYR
jgi:hypothetical protein